jgi:hypothetical protein
MPSSERKSSRKRNPGSGRANGVLSIELSEAQVAQVVRAASGSPNGSGLMSRLRNVSETLDVAASQLNDPRLSRSLLAGLVVLASFPSDGRYVGNRELAETLGMSVSNTHRYISTLLAAGLIDRDPASRKYRLAL